MMHKKDVFLYVGLFFLVLGIFVSVTIPSLFHILGAIPLSLYFWRSFKDKTLSLPVSSIILIIYIVLGYLSNLLNEDTLSHSMRAYGKQKYLIFAILGIGAFPAFFKSYMTQKRTSFLIKTFFFTIILASIVGFIKIGFKFDPIKWQSGYSGNRSEGLTKIMRYGYGTGFIVSVLLGLVLYKNKFSSFISSKWLYLTLVFAILGLFASGCRGAILGTFCSIPFLVYFKNKKLGLGIFTLGLATLLGTLYLVLFGSVTNIRFFQKISAASNLIRLSQYEAAVYAVKEKPLFGHGINQFSTQCKRVKEKNGLYWVDYCKEFDLSCDLEYYHKIGPYCSHAHNIFLETSANRGFIGLILFTLWLLFWLFEMYKRGDTWGYLIIPFIINFVVAGQFEYALDANNSFLIFLIYPLSFLKKEHLSFLRS